MPPRSIQIARSEGAAPADDPEQDHHDGDNQEDMDEAAHGVGSDQPQKPQDDQNYGDGIKHVDYPFVVEFEFPLIWKAPKPIFSRSWASDWDAPLFGGLPFIGAILRFDFHRLCAPPYIRRKFLAVVFAHTKSSHHAAAPSFLQRRVA